jgi:hypothetical protein
MSKPGCMTVYIWWFFYLLIILSGNLPTRTTLDVVIGDSGCKHAARLPVLVSQRMIAFNILWRQESPDHDNNRQKLQEVYARSSFNRLKFT